MVRAATPQDAKEIALLDEMMFVDHLDYNFILGDISNNPFAKYFVYEADGIIVGYIGSWITDNTEILNFCVLDQYQKQGIGSILFNEICKIKEGIISLEVRESNEKAINFYLKKGFIASSRRRAYYSNGEDAILMVRK